MKEEKLLNAVLNKPVNKKCKKCKQLLPIAFFSKKTKSKDGFQEWCKFCQKQNYKKNNELKKKNKRNSQLNILSYYHRHYGLQYEFLQPKKKNDYRKYIAYNCLNCGSKIKSSIKTAIKNKFVCICCADNNNIKTLINKNKSDLITKCTCEDCKNTNSEFNYNFHKLNDELTKDEIFNKIKNIHNKLRQNNNLEDNIHIFLIQTNEKKHEKVGLWNWIKNLFNNFHK